MVRTESVGAAKTAGKSASSAELKRSDDTMLLVKRKRRKEGNVEETTDNRSGVLNASAWSPDVDV